MWVCQQRRRCLSWPATLAGITLLHSPVHLLSTCDGLSAGYVMPAPHEAASSCIAVLSSYSAGLAACGGQAPRLIRLLLCWSCRLWVECRSLLLGNTCHPHCSASREAMTWEPCDQLMGHSCTARSLLSSHQDALTWSCRPCCLSVAAPLPPLRPPPFGQAVVTHVTLLGP